MSSVETQKNNEQTKHNSAKAKQTLKVYSFFSDEI